MKKLDNILSKIEQYFIGILILIITIILFINVVLRYFNMSFDWAEEFARYGIVWVTFIGASVCIYKGAHIGVDALLSFLSNRGKKVLTLITIILAVIFTAFFTLQSLNLTLKVLETGQVSSTIEVSMAYIYGAMPVGGALMLIRYIQQLIKTINCLKEDMA
ncbi:TRAP transporter small permease [Brassicibacter mesophilus]|uniref:TRAP transporter small permease n=1 Tax=Brassicibacter mesophilus TaxID=745119 RepID=UPI003D245B80